jgi:acid phosphatase family membrane protein YuiD
MRHGCCSSIGAEVSRLGMLDALARWVVDSNRLLILAVTAMLSAQVLKVPTHWLLRREWDPRRVVGAGGMPSSHSAMVTALATAVGYTRGFRSDLFAVTLVFALIVLYDAVGIRQAVGRQSAFLNRMQRETTIGQVMRVELPEMVGHTPLEVLAGAAWGVLLTILFY